jgi:transposase-like protein
VGRRAYPAEFRRKMLDLVESGRPIAEVATVLGISEQTIYLCGGRSASTRASSPARRAPSVLS